MRGSLETVGLRVNAGAGESAEERVGASPGVGGPASEPFSDRTDDFDCPVRQDLLGGQMKRYHSVQQEPLIAVVVPRPVGQGGVEGVAIGLDREEPQGITERVI